MTELSNITMFEVVKLKPVYEGSDRENWRPRGLRQRLACALTELAGRTFYLDERFAKVSELRAVFDHVKDAREYIIQSDVAEMKKANRQVKTRRQVKYKFALVEKTIDPRGVLVDQERLLEIQPFED